MAVFFVMFYALVGAITLQTLRDFVKTGRVGSVTYTPVNSKRLRVLLRLSMLLLWPIWGVLLVAVVLYMCWGMVVED